MRKKETQKVKIFKCQIYVSIVRLMSFSNILIKQAAHQGAETKKGKYNKFKWVNANLLSKQM